jgi:hypothetical protein
MSGQVRCVGTLHGPPGDCLTPIAGALLCYGYLDRDDGVPMRDSLEGPRPLLFGACRLHRPGLVDWAEHLWGQVADAMWLPPEVIPRALAFFDMERDPVVVQPDPDHAVRITV